jgi:hypothetical protein
MEPIRIVERLKSRMSSCAEPSSTHRIQGITFDLLNACDSLAKLLPFTLDDALPFHHASDNATAATTFSADRRMPLLLSRNDFAFGDEEWDQRVGLVTAATGRYSRGDTRHNLEKIAAIHKLKHVLPWREPARLNGY